MLILGGKLLGACTLLLQYSCIFKRYEEQDKPRINLCTQGTQVYTWRLHSGWSYS